MIAINPGLKTWNKAEYAEGLRARFGEIDLPEHASHSYRCGWEDADIELLESVRHQLVVAEGRENDYGPNWGLLFDAGEDVRGHGLAFDPNRRSLGKRAGSRQT